MAIKMTYKDFERLETALERVEPLTGRVSYKRRIYGDKKRSGRVWGISLMDLFAFGNPKGCRRRSSTS